MALVVKDRVKETTSTTGSTDAYNLAGAVTGFQTFDSALSDGDTTYYCCTDGTDFEVGRGTFTASGTTLARTTVLESSNSNNAVNWSSGTRDIFITQPAEKAVFLNADGDIEFDNTHRIKINSNTSDPVLAIAGGGPNFIRFHDAAGFNSTTNAVDIIYRTTPNDLLIERASGENIAEFGGDDGHAALYFNDSKKLETLTGGVDVTGNITVSGTVDGRDLATDGTKLDGIEASADVTDTTNVTAAGALMDSEVTNLAQVKAFDSSDYATAAQGTTADAAMPKAGGTFTGDVTFTGASYNVVWDKSDNAFELADNAKLKFGAGDDMAIFSDGTYGRIDTNHLIIRGDDTDDKPQIYFQSYNTSNVVDYDTSTSFYFQGPNDAGEQVTYNVIHSVTLDVSDGTEDGRIQFSQLQAGASETTFIFDPYYFLLMSEQQLAWYQYNGSYSTYINPITPTANRFIKLPDRDGLVRVVDQQAMTANLAVGWHTIAVFQGRDDSPDGANQRFHAKFSLIDITSSRHQAMTFYAQHMYGQDDGLQVIGNSTFNTDVVTAIRVKSSTDGNKTYAGAAIQVYVANATNNLVLYLDEANLDDGENGVSYGHVILKTGVADASDPGDLGYSTAGYSTFAESVQIAINSIEPGGIGVTGNLLTQSNIVLEGATADAYETIITATDATADRTITLPNETGTVALTSDINSTNVTAAGALMDSEVTNLAQVKAFDSSDYATAAQGTTADAAMPKAGGAFTGDVTFTGANYNIVFDKSDDALEFADNAKATFGADADLQIYHDGSHSYIKDTGTGNIRLPTSRLQIRNAANNATMLNAVDGGKVGLFHNGTEKLETTSGGISVSGEVAATSLDISGDVDVDGTLEADAMTLNGTAITTTATLSTGISNGNLPVFTSGVADDDFLRVNGTSIEGRSASELASDIGAATTDDATALAIALG